MVTSTDLLLTGHENGTVNFWRLGPGGCARKVFTLYTGSLFDGEFGPDAGGDARRDGDDESDPWPPFRRAGLFDPFMDDPRAAVKCIQLVENTLVVGGAAGQVTVWQFAEEKPVLKTVDVPIVQELPGFRWKGHAPLKPITFLCVPSIRRIGADTPIDIYKSTVERESSAQWFGINGFPAF
ncbi:unnamed protein product [Dibothriocephalus latus]|uniref:Lethal giant larvae homologue 2 domain-containing protein n=1 Tax=Dibothriocephalus latus TaxID=60516 RepID=A0A3P7MC38_DIBLA|nr:unnamed protein product [Dibothriocephalus latus]